MFIEKLAEKLYIRHILDLVRNKQKCEHDLQLTMLVYSDGWNENKYVYKCKKCNKYFINIYSDLYEVGSSYE